MKVFIISIIILGITFLGFKVLTDNIEKTLEKYNRTNSIEEILNKVNN